MITQTQTQTTKVKNGTIVLPKKFQRIWQETDVFIEVSPDTIFVKRLTQPFLSLKEMMDEFRQAAQKTKLSRREVEKVIQRTRKKIYQ